MAKNKITFPKARIPRKLKKAYRTYSWVNSPCQFNQQPNREAISSVSMEMRFVRSTKRLTKWHRRVIAIMRREMRNTIFKHFEQAKHFDVNVKSEDLLNGWRPLKDIPDCIIPVED